MFKKMNLGYRWMKTFRPQLVRMKADMDCYIACK